MSLLASWRHLLHGSDAARAMADEQERVGREVARTSALEKSLTAAYSSRASRAVDLGTTVRGQQPVRLPPERIVGFWGLWGPSGSGKSYLCVKMLLELLRSGFRSIACFDPKGETVGLLKRAVIHLAKTLPKTEAEQLLGRVVCLDPFSSTALPRLQLLAPEPGLDAEIQAYLMARLLSDDIDAAVGVRQESLLHRTIECLIRAGLPLTVLPRVLSEPLLLDALAERHGPAELFRATAERLRTESRERVGGILARAERLLRLSSTRLALSAPDCLDFAGLLDGKIVLANLEPPQGSVDVGRFMCGVLWVKLTQAIRRRANGSAPAMIVLEEAPAFLAAGTTKSADALEDILRLARAKGVFVSLLSQDLGSLAKIAPTLPTVIRTNVQLHAVFRAVPSDDWSFLLPVTGRRQKERSAPWEERRFGYLDRGAELALLKEEHCRLPDRQAYFVDRRSGLPGVLLRTADLALRVTDAEVRALDERAAGSGAVVAVAALEKESSALEARLTALLGGRPAAVDAVVRPIRRVRRPLDMG